MKKLLFVLLICLPTWAEAQRVGTCFQGLSTCGPNLLSLTVTPVNPTLTIGSTVTLQVQGVESDSTSGGLLTAQCDSHWSSSNTSVAIVSNSPALAGGVWVPSGTVTALAAGTSTITCTLNPNVTGSTTITVPGNPIILLPTCGTPPCILPQGSTGTAYSYTPSASPAGGTWTINVGSLPGWASLNASTGVISGTPNAAGTTNFTLAYTLGSTASVAVSLTVVAGCGPTGSPLTLPCASTSTAAITYPSTPLALGTETGSGNITQDTTFVTTGVPVVRLTDSLFNPAGTGTCNPSPQNSFSVSNGGADIDNWWSASDHFTFVADPCGFSYLVAINPATLAVSRPYSTATTGCQRSGNCSQYGGFSLPTPVQMSRSNDCEFFQMVGTAAYSYTMGSDASTTNGNSCSGAISGPPAQTLVENFIQVNANCLPTNFGSPTWTDFGETADSDALLSGAWTSVNYHYGTGTGQNNGIYFAVWSPTKGCLTINTQTGAIVGDTGWSGGAGLTCTTQCTGTITTTDRFTIHHMDAGLDGSRIYVQWSTCISGACVADNPYVWIVGTNVMYESEDSTKTSGHWAAGYLGITNGPGNPFWQWYYRTNPSSGTPGAPVAVNVLPTGSVTNLDVHFAWQMGNATDTNPFVFASTGFSQSSLGCCEQPFEIGQPSLTPGPWVSELDASQTSAAAGTNVVYREMPTYNTSFCGQFNCQENILTCSKDLKFCSWGTDNLNAWGNAAGTSTSCIGGGPSWAASKAYPTNYLIKPPSSHGNAGLYTFKATTHGTAGSTEPTWPQTVGATVSDGGVVWTNQGQQTGTAQCRTDVVAAKLQ